MAVKAGYGVGKDGELPMASEQITGGTAIAIPKGPAAYAMEADPLVALQLLLSRLKSAPFALGRSGLTTQLEGRLRQLQALERLQMEAARAKVAGGAAPAAAARGSSWDTTDRAKAVEDERRARAYEDAQRAREAGAFEMQQALAGQQKQKGEFQASKREEAYNILADAMRGLIARLAR